MSSYDPALANLVNQIAALQTRLLQVERNQRTAQLPTSSIDNGAITVNDSSGNAALVLGLQPDGTFTTQSVTALAPPLPPSDPVVQGMLLALLVTWDGKMSDGSTPLSDFSDVEVHCSQVPNFTPDSTTIQGSLTKSGFFAVTGLDPTATYYVTLVAVNEAGNTSVPSNYLSASPSDVPSNIPPGSITSPLIAAGAIIAGMISAGAIDGQTINDLVLNSVVINGDTIAVSGPNNGLFAYSSGGLNLVIFNTHGDHTWVAPAGVTSIAVFVQGSGGCGGSINGGAVSGAGGGGGGCQVDTTFSVTPGNTYYMHVGQGASGGLSSEDSWFNSVNGTSGAMIGQAGQFGQAGLFSGGSGGGGSGPGTSFTGGNGGDGAPSTGKGGGGGGGGAGSGGNGGNGSAGSGTGGAAGGTAGASGSGGPSGAHGATGGASTTGGPAGPQPGAGGGGGGSATGNHPGGKGGDGQVWIIYTSSTTQLSSSVTGAVGVDPVNGGAVPAGFFGPALELVPQVSAPVPAGTDASVYADVNGTPSYVRGSGYTGALSVGGIDNTNFTVTQSAYNDCTTGWTIPGGDASTSVIYRLYCSGNGNQGSTQQDMAGQVVLRASAVTGLTLGAATIPVSQTFAFDFTMDIHFTAVGASGAGYVIYTLGWTQTAIQTSTSNNATDRIKQNFSGFDTTTSWGLKGQLKWGAVTGSPTVTCYYSILERLGS